jgi:tetratricopeptide (TPR) repeat protein
VPAQPVAETPKKSKKKLFIVLGAVALVVLIAVGAFVGFSLWRASVYEQGVAALTEENYGEAHDLFTELGSYKDARELADTARKGLEYDAALELVRVEDYVAARDVFESLGSFKDAADQALLCQQNIDYQEAIAAFEQGDFEHAREVFSDLAANQFSDAVNWRDKSIYAIADEKYKAEDRYGAYQIFRGLGSFEDAADRAQQCTTAYPSTGELYHNPDYASSVSTLVVDGVNATYVSYYKVYDGDTLISTFFLHPGAKCNIDLPPGNYTIKESTGDAWFGEEILFGDEGLYGIMTFDGGKDYLELGRNIEVTITLSVIGELTGDTVGSSSTDREGF